MPGADTSDGELYIITELGEYSLKEYLQQGDRRSKAAIKSITMATMLVAAGLHAKGFVHMDLKPENLMVFDGRLKLIDVDGCVEIGSTVSVDDHSLSYSPLYCAPEWANFLVADSEDDTMTVSPALDVWSIGMTVCELAWHKPIFSKPRGSLKRTEYWGWVSDLQSAPLPASVRDFDEGFVDLLSTCLLVPEKTRRKSLIESLDHPFLSQTLTPEELMESSLSHDIFE
jgi:serine/threonine protein kinase